MESNRLSEEGFAMRYQIDNAAKRKNKENAREYILYMILSSYFAKTECKNRMLERKLYLYYQELPVSQQMEEEANVIRLLEEHYRDALEDWVGLKAAVHILTEEDRHVILCQTGFQYIYASASHGRYILDIRDHRGENE